MKNKKIKFEYKTFFYVLKRLIKRCYSIIIKTKQNSII